MIDIERENIQKRLESGLPAFAFEDQVGAEAIEGRMLICSEDHGEILDLTSAEKVEYDNRKD